ncbi:class A beta-lactamase [Nocardia stercoris]|uniref:Beta-lactamase n=1 Tax=Nocardia stercoris TaxID=2483361 RepID=A0A3M2LE54_9NOCA|nr:class A beta-lactamase [Nocardia stercoris]RMI35326.1 class A beta-lactamase [Nocardia stercoris]
MRESTLRKCRALAAVLLFGPLAACGSTTSTTPTPSATPAAVSANTPAVDAEFAAMEQEHGARVGLFAVDIRTGKTVGYRADERFGMASTFKALAAAAVLRAHPISTGYLDQTVHFTSDDVVQDSPVTSKHLDSGMSIRELCDAAITYSDNTAGNLLLKQIGGPQGLTAFARSIGDEVTHLDRWEPELDAMDPGDDRDTTTPAALTADYRALIFGDVLATPERDQLTAWLVANKTGNARIRAALPPDWKTGDKTGTALYGSANDVAVTWPADGTGPLVVAVLTTKPDQAAAADNPLVAAVAKVAVTTVHG